MSSDETARVDLFEEILNQLPAYVVLTEDVAISVCVIMPSIFLFISQSPRRTR